MTPDISLKEAIKLAFNGTEKNGVLTCKGLVINEKCTIVLDGHAREGVKALEANKKAHLAENLMLQPGMGIIIKPQAMPKEDSIEKKYNIKFYQWEKHGGEIKKAVFTADATIADFIIQHRTKLTANYVIKNDQNHTYNDFANAVIEFDPLTKRLVVVFLASTYHWNIGDTLNVCYKYNNRSPLFQKTYQQQDKIAN